MTLADAAEHARKAAERADVASRISSGMWEFEHDNAVTEADLPRLAFEVLTDAVAELAHAIEHLATAQGKS